MNRLLEIKNTLKNDEMTEEQLYGTYLELLKINEELNLNYLIEKMNKDFVEKYIGYGMKPIWARQASLGEITNWMLSTCR